MIGAEFRIERLRDDQRPRAAVSQHEAVVVLGHQRVDRDRDHAGLDRAEERRRPVDGVGEADQDAFAAPDPERPQHMTEPLGALGERAVAPGAARIDIGGLLHPACVAEPAEQIVDEIVVARDGGRGVGRRRRTRRGLRFGPDCHRIPLQSPAIMQTDQTAAMRCPAACSAILPLPRCPGGRPSGRGRGRCSALSFLASSASWRARSR